MMLQDTFLLEVLSSFSRKEIRELSYFLESPLFNRRKDVLDLCNFISRKLISENKKIEAVEAYSAVFGKEKYDNQKLRLTISRLLKLVEQFMIIKEIENNVFEKEKLLMSAITRRKLDRNSPKILKSALKKLDKQPLRNADYHFSMFYFENQNYIFLSESGRNKELNLRRMDEELNAAFISSKLRQVCFSLSHQAVSGEEYEFPFLQQVYEMAEKEPFQSLPSVAVYYQFLKLFEKGNESQFDFFKEILFRYRDQFNQEEFRDIYLLAINFCIRKINESKSDFFYKALDLYKKGLELELLFHNGQITRFTYNNIVGIALRIDDPLWVESFISTYKNYLSPPHNETAYNLNMARLEFVKKDYRKALSFVQFVDYKDLIDRMNAKILQVKIYYELEEFNALHSQLSALKVFIRRKKNVGYHYELWKNIIYYVQKLAAINPYDKKEILNLKDQIKQEAILAEKEWLIEKLESI